MPRKVFAAVRNVNGDEWIDVSTVAILAEQSQDVVDKDAKLIPGWHKENPVLRICLFNLTEVR